MSVNRTLVEAKLCTFHLESTDFYLQQFYHHIQDGASAKFSTNSHETDYSVHSAVLFSQINNGSRRIIFPSNPLHRISLKNPICRLMAEEEEMIDNQAER